MQSNQPSAAISIRVKTQMDKCERELDAKLVEFGPDHPEVAQTLGTLGLLNQHMTKDFNRAVSYHKEALRILRKGVDEKNPAVKQESLKESLAVTLTDLAFIHEQTAEFGLALEEYREARQVLKSINRNKSDPRYMASELGVDRVSRSMK